LCNTEGATINPGSRGRRLRPKAKRSSNYLPSSILNEGNNVKPLVIGSDSTGVNSIKHRGCVLPKFLGDEMSLKDGAEAGFAWRTLRVPRRIYRRMERRRNTALGDYE